MEYQFVCQFVQFFLWVTCLFVISGARVCLRRRVAEPKLLVDAQNFVELVDRSDVFVDNSLFIKSFITHNDKVVALHVPSGWGKTTNLDMLDTFLRMETDLEGNIVHSNSTSAFKIFSRKSNPDDSSELEISHHSDIVDNFLGQHPVIRVNFHPFPGAFTVNNFYESLKNALFKAFMEHKYMLRVFTRIRDDAATDTYKRMVAGHNSDLFLRHLNRSTTDEETNRGVDFLNGVLRNHFGRPPYILFDDYDQFFRKMLSEKVHETNVKQVLHHFTGFLKTSLKHSNINKALIVGILSIGTSGLLDHDVENAVYNNLLDDIFPNPFRGHIGFSEKDLNTLFQECKIKEDLADSAKRWYRGYSFPRFSGSEKVYNPLDVVNFLKAKAIRNYWLNSESSYLKIFRIMLRSGNSLEANLVSLLTGNPIVVVGGLSLNDDDLIKLNKYIMSRKRKPLQPTFVDKDFLRLCSLFLATGYMTMTGDGGVEREVCLPNQEISSEMTKIIKEHYFESYQMDEKVWKRVGEEFYALQHSNNTEPFVKALGTLFRGISEDASMGRLPLDAREINQLILNVFSILVKTTYESLWTHGELEMVPSHQDSCLVLRFKNRAMMIGLRYNESPHQALKDTENVKDLFEIIRDAETITFMSINLSKTKGIQLKMKHCAFENLVDVNKSDYLNF